MFSTQLGAAGTMPSGWARKAPGASTAEGLSPSSNHACVFAFVRRGEISGQFEGGRFSSAGLVALLPYCWGGSHLCLCIRPACCWQGRQRDCAKVLTKAGVSLFIRRRRKASSGCPRQTNAGSQQCSLWLGVCCAQSSACFCCSCQ